MEVVSIKVYSPTESMGRRKCENTVKMKYISSVFTLEKNKYKKRIFMLVFFFFDYDKILSEYYFSSNDFGKT